jgi:hypothetical protein
MASAMLATYPEVFAGGAIVAGLPYGCAASAQQAFEAMFNERSTSARALGDRVRAASSHQGPWPKISVWHGSADAMVKPSNAEDIVRQWTNVHGLPAGPAYEEKVAGHIRRVWNDANGNTIMEAFSLGGMGHGVPIATGMGCGAPGPFFLDVGISSTQSIAQFWGLANVGARARSSAGREALSAASVAARSREVEVIAPARASARDDGVETVVARCESADDHRARGPFDPNAVIAAAFKAAGLQSPKATIQPPGSPVAPGPIIEAALKAARLMRT